MFGLELRAVVMVETGMVSDDGRVGFWERCEEACCEP